MINNIFNLYQKFLESNGVTTDTRSIKQNQIFFALKGDNFNANQFAQKALEIGASYVVIDDEVYNIDVRCILVENVLHTLQQLALHHRRQIQLKALLAITGSNGKTTTKELVHAVIKEQYKTHATKGNLNNHIGIPITLLEMPLDTEIAIIEMGANHQNEIAQYCTYTEPTHGIITNIGKAHLEGFGGVDGIIKGKGELFDYLTKNNGTAIYNADDAILCKMIEDKQIKNKYAYSVNQVNIVQEFPNIIVESDTQNIKTNLFGKYNLSNVLCAIKIGQLFQISIEKIKQGIENYFPNNKRSELIEKEGYQLILDYYNANPTSMQHALENFSLSKNKNRIVILGDMFELGNNASEEHQHIAKLAEDLNFEKIVLVGKNFKNVIVNKAIKFDTSDEAKIWFKSKDKLNSEILIKGSRGMKMENILSE
ncbi:MAG: UDP-N-acetylmuramoyl-tripeptide--D-alanyl-D-alanine ligase [Sphingobacteriales bacterium]|nr:MAG: UDP-N-acetylmuramoyl-tripeptide--D-alanyl-D-alanine ligase [Sphingobacteriales bacterium]